MNWTIRSNALKLLATGEFAVFDNEFRWRFFRENASDEFPVELPWTSDRFKLLSEADYVVPLYHCPESFKSGFLRALYGTSLPYGGQATDLGGERAGTADQTDLKWLLFFMGFRAGSQVKAHEIPDLLGAELTTLPFGESVLDILVWQPYLADICSEPGVES